MARQTPADAAKAKAAKQKKIVIGLGCVLALAMAYAVHTMMALNGGGGSKPVAAPATATTPAATPSATTPAATPTAAPTLSGSLAVAPATPAATDTSGLVAAVKPSADPGQLESFSRFASKDPFAGATSSGSGAGSSGSGSGGSSTGSGPTAPPVVPPAPPSPPPTSAVISVNDVPEVVNTGADFPTANPVASANGLFELRSLTEKTATVSIVGGSYASGSQTLTLHVNKPVTLVNTADGTRYKLLLSPQGTVAPTAGGSSAPTATTPTSTTPSSGG